MAIDIHYNLYASGSTALTNASQGLFGNFAGLSILNASDVVIIEAYALNTHSFRIAPSGISQGVRVTPAASIVRLFPMRARNASGIQAHIDAPSGNASAAWVAWIRQP